jgi:hypothetical protein
MLDMESARLQMAVESKSTHTAEDVYSTQHRAASIGWQKATRGMIDISFPWIGSIAYVITRPREAGCQPLPQGRRQHPRSLLHKDRRLSCPRASG